MFFETTKKWMARGFKEKNLGSFKNLLHGAVVRDICIRDKFFSKKKRLTMLNFFCQKDYFEQSEIDEDQNDFIGVSFDKNVGLYQSCIKEIRYTKSDLGYFNTAIEAARCHDQAVLQLWIERCLCQCRMPSTNFPPQDYGVTVPEVLEWDYLKKCYSAELNRFMGTK